MLPRSRWNATDTARFLFTLSADRTTWSYDQTTLALTNKTHLANGVSNSIARSYDTLGRASGIALDTNYAVDYAYSNTSVVLNAYY